MSEERKRTKVFSDAQAALHDLTDGIRLMSGGFGLCGIPENSIQEIARQGIKKIHAISNNIGNSGRGLAILLKNRQIVEATCSFVGGNPELLFHPPPPCRNPWECKNLEFPCQQRECVLKTSPAV